MSGKYSETFTSKYLELHYFVDGVVDHSCVFLVKTKKSYSKAGPVAQYF